jgi:hypothetical protein
MIADEDMGAAQRRLKTGQQEALIVARAFRAVGHPPTLTLRCGTPEHACTMLAVWWTPQGALWWHPPVKRSARRAEREGRPGERFTPEAAGLLADTVQAAGGGLLANLARCRHEQASVASRELVERVTAAQRLGRPAEHRLGAADADWIERVV